MLSNSDIVPPYDPWILFREWYALAEQHEPDDPGAMALATTDTAGAPSVRIVLLRGHEDGKLVFFTNRESRKGVELLKNPRAAVCLYWKSIDRQIRAEGNVTVLADAESDAYFSARLRGSQIAAWSSQQSGSLPGRETLVARVKEVEKQYEGKPVPRPPYWGGYQLIPQRVEFWQEREFRLHDRIVYHRKDVTSAWAVERLYP